MGSNLSEPPLLITSESTERNGNLELRSILVFRVTGSSKTPGGTHVLERHIVFRYAHFGLGVGRNQKGKVNKSAIKTRSPRPSLHKGPPYTTPGGSDDHRWGLHFPDQPRRQGRKSPFKEAEVETRKDSDKTSLCTLNT